MISGPVQEHVNLLQQTSRPNGFQINPRRLIYFGAPFDRSLRRRTEKKTRMRAALREFHLNIVFVTWALGRGPVRPHRWMVRRVETVRNVIEEQ